MAKNLRRKCDNPKCGKMYRYKSAASRYCSDACRKAVSRQRKAEKDKAARERAVTEIAAKLRQRQQIESQIEPQPDSPAPQPDSPAPPAPAKKSSIYSAFRPPADPPVVITIRNIPRHFPGTPLPRRW